jgi:L-cysteine:1D-myo-inositol 2-amino-2-deoxy-alpha-D-glucopyranoside ligase
VRLFDTAVGEKVAFEPGAVVTIYTCGITPYDSEHMGHAATYLAYDILQRRLIDTDRRCRVVRNVTDVDDDILRKSRELGVFYLDLAAEEMARFDANMKALNLLPPESEPRATGAIPDVLSAVAKLLDSGLAYQSGGGVYFRAPEAPGFGDLSRLDRDSMLRLAADNGGSIDDPAKRDPLDVVLWQPSAQGEPSWESRWGPGRPGWHIECAAIATRELGATVDLHGGGRDLVFPHHENEAAQARTVTGQPLARHWMHTGMVGLGGEKMSKSKGNLVFVSQLLEKWDPMVVRAALLAHHYRYDWEWSDDLLEVATERLERWRRSGEGTAGLDGVRAALDDDLDTPRALGELDAAVAGGGGAGAALELLGLA